MNAREKFPSCFLHFVQLPFPAVELSLFLAALSIFALRILDVSIGTLRIGMLVRGHRGLAGLFSFFESLIWLAAAAQVLGNLDSPAKFIAYAGGYAAGTMLGSTLEKWIAIGNSLVRIVSPTDSPDPSTELRKLGYYATVVNGSGRDGDVRISFSVIPRKKVQEVLELVQRINPQAFVTFEETTPVRVNALPAASLRK